MCAHVGVRAGVWVGEREGVVTKRKLIEVPKKQYTNDEAC